MFSQVGWFFTGALALASTTFADPQYFRSNNGVAAEAGSVPADFNSPKTPVWRTPLDSGHSSPIFSNGKIFLTTSNPGKHELATIALDAQSGTVLWKAVVPAVKIEDFHPQEGNAAMATPACEGDRGVVLFGSQGLICY
jgi:outer membrane protein assembly factor BamB